MNKAQMEFATRVKYKVLAEPDLVTMKHFTTKITEENKQYDCYKNLRCTTVGCIAGWACLLNSPDFSSGSRDAEDEAKFLLGLSHAEAHSLFFFHTGEGQFSPAYRHLRKALERHLAGTAGYAKIVAKAIDLCIERNYHPRRSK